MQTSGQIEILTSLSIQQSPWKDVRLPLVKLVSCIETSSSLPTKPYMLGYYHLLHVEILEIGVVYDITCLESKSPSNTVAAASFRSILMAKCRVCACAMNGDNRLGAIRRTLRCLPLLWDRATDIEHKGKGSQTTTSSSAVCLEYQQIS